MPTKNKPYSQFGSYLLFKRLEHDSLGELWRAAKIENGALGEAVALRRLLGGDRQALLATVQTATYIAPVLTGTTIVRGQVIGAIEGIPFVAHDYAGGRSLRHIVDRARGGTMANPQPIPVDQALAITEKVALSLESIGNLKHQGQRLTHGALLPQFVWITDEGEIRTAGQQLGKGLVASLRQPELAREIASYFAPEIRGDGEPTAASDVYALGAILSLLLTGQEPPDALNPSFFDLAISRSTLMASEKPIPDDIRSILKRSLALDPVARYASPAEMRQDLDKLLGTGAYAPTTFNLAFYLHTLLKKEMEGEALDRDKEQKVNLAPYVEEMAAVSHTATADFLAGVAPDLSGTPIPAKKSRMPLIAAVLTIVVLAGGAVAAYYLGYFGPKSGAGTKTAGRTKPAPIPSANTATLAPVITAVAADSPELTPATTTDTATAAPDAATRQRAMEDEINRRLQMEIAKLQSEYNRKLEAEQPKTQPAPSPSAAASTQIAAVTPPREQEPSAAQLDAARRSETRATEPAASTTVATTTVAPQTPIQEPAPAPVSQPVVEEVREGDLIGYDKVDIAPRLTSQVKPVYPPMALRQRLEADVLMTVLVTESGKVADARILRGDNRRIGFDEAALRAIRSATFTPALKSGKRVKVWMPIPIKFRL